MEKKKKTLQKYSSNYWNIQTGQRHMKPLGKKSKGLSLKYIQTHATRNKHLRQQWHYNHSLQEGW